MRRGDRARGAIEGDGFVVDDEGNGFDSNGSGGANGAGPETSHHGEWPGRPTASEQQLLTRACKYLQTLAGKACSHRKLGCLMIMERTPTASIGSETKSA